MPASATCPAFDIHQAWIHAAHLPATPRVLGRLLSAVADGNTDLRFLADLLRLEPVLAAELLRVANSPLFGFRQPAAGVEEAVLRVGMREAHRIIGAAATVRVFRADLNLYGTTADALWENAVITAMAAERLALATGQDPASAHAAGLLRSVGKMVLARHAAAQAGTVSLADSGRTLPEWERASFGTTHAEVGAALCEYWRLPRTVGLALHDHLAPATDPATFALPHLLHFAGAAAVMNGHGLPGEETIWSNDPAQLGRVGLTPGLLDDVAHRAANAFARMQETLALIRG